MSETIRGILAGHPEGLSASQIRARYARALGLHDGGEHLARIWLLYALYATANSYLEEMEAAGQVTREVTGRRVRYRLTALDPERAPSPPAP